MLYMVSKTKDHIHGMKQLELVSRFKYTGLISIGTYKSKQGDCNVGYSLEIIILWDLSQSSTFYIISNHSPIVVKETHLSCKRLPAYNTSHVMVMYRVEIWKPSHCVIDGYGLIWIVLRWLTYQLMYDSTIIHRLGGSATSHFGTRRGIQRLW